jgi:hypothetical protein
MSTIEPTIATTLSPFIFSLNLAPLASRHRRDTDAGVRHPPEMEAFRGPSTQERRHAFVTMADGSGIHSRTDQGASYDRTRSTSLRPMSPCARKTSCSFPAASSLDSRIPCWRPACCWSLRHAIRSREVHKLQSPGLSGRVVTGFQAPEARKRACPFGGNDAGPPNQGGLAALLTEALLMRIRLPESPARPMPVPGVSSSIRSMKPIKF